MNIPKEMLVDAKLKGIADKLKPSVFRQGDSYCVLYGADAQNGILGYGISIEEALTDWEGNLIKTLHNDIEIKRVLAHTNPPQDVSAFLDDYRDRAKHDETGYDINKQY
ncbi:hypothetical protein [Pedobacter sp. Leaf176]|uniref:hypothetical protein n=1 Tax=Pedobacter sp. Leaf176 TaxID=1736286 RepID=UPI0006F21E65|nr:hypothetical protein [Pedobacter sp. Leaf176]KQR72241.1 hypothetical protein ASF92_02805 [Pedobacter sp. Leaf176]